jgi:hypothetical protein
VNVPADIRIIYFEHAGVFKCPRSSLYGCTDPSWEDRADEARRLMLCVSSSIQTFTLDNHIAGIVPERRVVAWDAALLRLTVLLMAACFESAINVGEGCHYCLSIDSAASPPHFQYLFPVSHSTSALSAKGTVVQCCAEKTHLEIS